MKPKVVCLCGSTRFFEAWQRVAFDESLAGRITVGVAFWHGAKEHGQMAGITPEQKEKLDELHMRRIDLSDESFIINVDGYIGESTRQELAYTIATGKGLRFLEEANGTRWLRDHDEELQKLVDGFAARVKSQERHAAVRALNDAFAAFKRWKPDANWNSFIHACSRGDDPTAPSTIREQVSAFHKAFGQAIGDKPAVPDDETVRFRMRLIAEEFCEMLDAVFTGNEGIGQNVERIAEIRECIRLLIDHRIVDVNLPELVDAWGDIDYVVEGSRLAFGVNGEPVAAEIQRSNMSKLGADGKPVIRESDGKRLKGPNYSPPDIAGELRKQGWVP